MLMMLRGMWYVVCDVSHTDTHTPRHPDTQNSDFRIFLKSVLARVYSLLQSGH
jgi:hypothetical protein